MSENIELITQTAQELLEKLQIVGIVNTQEDLDGLYLVTIDTEEQGILIGFHGKNLESFQLMLGQLVYKKLEVWVRLSVSVGDYRERRAKQLQELAESAAQRVLAAGEPVALTDLSPSERRIVHLALEGHDQVLSQSEGEGRQRRLVVKLRPQP